MRAAFALSAMIVAVLILLGFYLYWAGEQNKVAEQCHDIGGVAVQEYGTGDAVCLKPTVSDHTEGSDRA